MKAVSGANLSLCAFLGVVSTLGAYAMTSMLINQEAAREILRIGTCWVGVGVCAMLALMPAARQTAVARCLFTALIVIFGLDSVLLGLSVPLFWMFDSDSGVHRGLCVYAVLIILHQGLSAYQDFVSCWKARSGLAFSRYQGRFAGTINVMVFISDLGTEAKLFLPRALVPLREVIYVALFVSMVAGLNLRKAYPEYSALAVGVPALTAFAMMTQISMFHVLLAIKLWGLQRTSGNIWRVTDDRPPKKRARSATR
jgi:hypothetical protein